VKVSLSAAIIVAILGAAGVGLWYRYQSEPTSDVTETVGFSAADDEWLEHLYSQNPKVAEEATEHLKTLGVDALPTLQAALDDPGADPQRKKAAFKAVGILGPAAAPLVGHVAEHLPDPALTAEAAVALSFMGRDAFEPLREALDSDDPVLRAEALRSIGKLRERAPLDARAVVPLLLKGMEDADFGVRTVAATYLGIVAESPETVVPVLIAALKDAAPEVRAAAATALGSFPSAASTAIPALRRATGDKNADVAREAGVSLVKLQGSRGK
jgi:HEAT repeat protein